jgi:integrase
VGAPNLVGFLRQVPRLLAAALPTRAHGKGGRKKRAPASRISSRCSLSARGLEQLLVRLDCDRDGNSLRSGRPAWPESWALATEICQQVGAERWLVLVLASWLESRAVTTRRTYASWAREALRDLRIDGVAELHRLPEQAALTWQRDLARRHLPRTCNAAVATINSLKVHVVRLLGGTWEPIPALRITRGRHLDREGVVLDAAQLEQFMVEASRRPQRQFLALLLASLHGLRAAEVAGLTWGALRHQRRGAKAAPAVLSVIGKGQKHRLVHVHQAVRGWLERARIGKDGESFILADATGLPPSPQVVSWWARDVFLRCGLAGYAHALRATWATLALENRENQQLQVQQSGGWRDPATMLGHYYKRRQVQPIRLVPGHGRY